MATCPDGHESTLDDYCSSCGLVMPASADDPASSSGAAGDGTNGSGCPNCSEAHAESAVFCENCGYDFLAGSMPGALSDPDPAVAGPAAALSKAKDSRPTGDSETDAPADAGASGAAGGVGGAWELVVSVDRSYFDRMSAEGQLDFPNPPSPETVVNLSIQKALLGRRSESRGVFPEVDILRLTGDPAVSTRHAMIEKQRDGTYSITDLSSTNGTFIGDADTAVTAGVATPLADGATVFLGAWTRLELRQV